MFGRLRLLAVSPSLLGERQLSQTTGRSEAGLVIPSAALATSTIVAGRELLVPGEKKVGVNSEYEKYICTAKLLILT